MFDRDELIDRAIEHLREPVRIDPGLDDRVLAAIAAHPAPRRAGGLRVVAAWLTSGRPIHVSPLGGLAAAAGLVAIFVLGRVSGGGGPSRTDASGRRAVPTVAQFVVVAPGASSVSLVGDFNDWDIGATPMRPSDATDVWSVILPLAPGRYRYSFLVDGTTWRADPGAPRALDDDFGRSNSVVTVGGS